MCPYEGFLNDIHGVVAIAGRPDGNRENLPMIAVEQLSEPLRIPRQGALDELPVILSQFTTSCLTATGRPKFSRLRRGYRLRAATKRKYGIQAGTHDDVEGTEGNALLSGALGHGD